MSHAGCVCRVFLRVVPNQDGWLNQGETGIDCGGPCPNPCPAPVCFDAFGTVVNCTSTSPTPVATLSPPGTALNLIPIIAGGGGGFILLLVVIVLWRRSVMKKVQRQRANVAASQLDYNERRRQRLTRGPGDGDSYVEDVDMAVLAADLAVADAHAAGGR